MKHFQAAGALALALLALGACAEEEDPGEAGDGAGASGSASTGAAGAGSAETSDAGTKYRCTPSTTGAGIGIPANCKGLHECLKQDCGDSYTQCLGKNYAKGDYSGGACANVFECMLACNCEPNCSEECYANDQECMGCVVGLFFCGYECQDELAACQG